MLLSQNGSILRNEVTGQVQMNTKLSGMPECKFGLNDKLVIDRDNYNNGNRKRGVEIDDCTFHRCVRLESSMPIGQLLSSHLMVNLS